MDLISLDAWSVAAGVLLALVVIGGIVVILQRKEWGLSECYPSDLNQPQDDFDIQKIISLEDNIRVKKIIESEFCSEQMRSRILQYFDPLSERFFLCYEELYSYEQLLYNSATCHQAEGFI